jgi:hypothetical protein
MGLEGIGFNRRRFRDLSEQEVLALAISSEEDDARIYRSYAQRLRSDFPDSAPSCSTAWRRRKTTTASG